MGRSSACPERGRRRFPRSCGSGFGIETPGKVFIHEEEGKIVVEPLPSVEAMQGVHAGRYEKGEVIQHLREMKAEDKQLEGERDESLERQQ